MPTAIFAWVVFKSDAKLRALRQPGGIDLGRFFDAQARSLVHGRWNVPASIAGYEAWIVDHKAYIYFGPFPALLRLPVLAITDRVDGRLTPWSMTLAFIVALVGCSRLLWRTRTLLHPGMVVSVWERWVAASWIFTLGAGSALMFQASVAWVYDEAVLWGVALALLGLDAVIGVTQRASPARVVVASGLATLAMLTRPTVGIGPAVALLLLALGAAVGAARRPSGWASRVARAVRAAAPLAAAGFVPILAFAVVQYAKFGTLNVPFSGWVAGRQLPILRSVIAHNNGSFFNVRIIPTALLAYLRPDSLELLHHWPYVGLPTHNTPALFGVHVVGSTASIPATMPLVFVLALVGGIALVRRSLRGDPVRALVPALIGAIVALVPGVVFAGFATRYLGDFLPPLVIMSGVAVCSVARLPDAGWRPSRRAWVVALSVLLVLSVTLTLAITADSYSPRRFVVPGARPSALAG